MEHIIASKEYQKRLLLNYYSNYLSRTPAPAELDSWFETFKHGLCHEFFQSTILGEREFFIHHCGSNVEQWFRRVNSALFGPATLLIGEKFLGEVQGKNIHPVQVVLDLLNTPEYRERFMQTVCNDYLGRALSEEEKQQWLTRINQAA